MAASIQGTARVLVRLPHLVLQSLRQHPSSSQWLHVRGYPRLPQFVPPSQFFCKAASVPDADAVEALSRYKVRPWDYLESEEYIERYGTNPVWTGYRRNHKGGIPPQKTRKTCIRRDKICGNPCPICRDPNIIITHQNVKLLQQFMSPHTGMVYDPTRTGVCMKQQKKLHEAIDTAQNHGGGATSEEEHLPATNYFGLLPFAIPHMEFSGEDYSNSHDAVGSTSPPQSLASGDPWYKWYSEITPDENEVAKVKKTYKTYLK